MTRRGLTALLLLVLATALAAPTATARGSQPGPTGPPVGHTHVIGGQQSAPGQWPWQVAILDARTSNTADAFFCGGAVISRSWVLTAAHCVVLPTGATRQASDIQILTGTNVLGDGSGQRNQVVAIHPNPAWDRATNQNDEALVRLAKPTDAQPITPVATSQGALWAPGTTATVSGWGNSSADPNQSSYPTHLRHATVPIQPDATCAAKYPPSRGSDLTFHAANMLCAGPLAGGHDTCNGDSGGPLMVPGPGGIGWVEAGITSWGYGCALPDNPGVYSRLGARSMATFVSLTRRFGPFDDTASFITRQFLDFQDRLPSSAELAAWSSHLSQNPPRDLITALESSSTWQDHAWAITRLFRATLSRDPDSAGLAYWVGKAFAGMPLTAVASVFTSSSEFEHLYGHLADPTFVDRAYRNVFGRQADHAGDAYWVRELSAGVQRGAVMVGLAESHEYRVSSDPRVRVITTWFGLIRRVPSSGQINAAQTGPLSSLIDSLRLSYSYALRF